MYPEDPIETFDYMMPVVLEHIYTCMQAWVDKIKNYDESSELPAQIMIS